MTLPAAIVSQPTLAIVAVSDILVDVGRAEAATPSLALCPIAKLVVAVKLRIWSIHRPSGQPIYLVSALIIIPSAPTTI